MASWILTSKGTEALALNRRILPTLLLFSVVSAGTGVDVSGYYKNFFLVIDPPEYATSAFNTLSSEGISVNRLRATMLVTFGSALSLHASYELIPEIKKNNSILYNNLFSFFDPLTYRADDFRKRLYPFEAEDIENITINHNLDRLFFSVAFPFADLKTGRQAFGWGSARIINPTDILTPFSFNALDKEERYGIDAVRFIIPLGSLNECEAGYVFGNDFLFENSAFFLRTKFYAFETDVSFIVTGFRGNLLAGIDMARSLGGAGIWCEAAHVFTDILDKDIHHSSGNDYFRLSVGADYNFCERFYGYGEYHFNSAGPNNTDSYLDNISTHAFTEGSVYLLGMHYGAIGGRYEVSPLLPATFMILYNFSDNSLCFLPELEYNMSEDVYISLGAIVGLGKKAENPFSPKSEFGVYPDAGYLSFRLYF